MTKGLTMTEMLMQFKAEKGRKVEILMDQNEFIFSDLKDLVGSTEMWRRMGATRFKLYLRDGKEAWSIALRAIAMNQIFLHLYNKQKIGQEVSISTVYGMCYIRPMDDGQIKMALVTGEMPEYRDYTPQNISGTLTTRESAHEFFLMVRSGCTSAESLMRKAAEGLWMRDAGREWAREEKNDMEDKSDFIPM